MTALVALLLASTCSECHRDQVERFEASRHAHAFTLPVFALPYRRANTGWCLGCHRPEGAGTVGLTCLSCHAADGEVPGSGAAHGQLRSDACAGCHQFDAPDSGEPLQNTVREAAGAACVSCHDVHSAPGAHDLPTLASALQVSAVETATGGVEVRVTSHAGHRFPTGDPFRRLVVSVCDDAACASPLGRRTLSKGFGWVGGWKKLRDGSLADGDAAVMEFPSGRFWRASYYYGDPRFEPELEPSEVVVEVARGSVTPRRR